MESSTPASYMPPMPAERQPDLEPSRGARKPHSRRKWSVGVSLALVTLLGAMTGAVVVARAGDRVNVLAVAKDVQAGQTITDQDVKSVSFAEDPGLSPIPSSRRASVVGQRAAVDLRQGSLLTQSQLRRGGGLGDDKQLVGVEVKKGFAPGNGSLAKGDEVLAVILDSPQGDDGGSASGSGGKMPQSGDPEQIEATVDSVGRVDATGTFLVNLIVDPAEGPRLSAMAAAKRLTLVRQPLSGGGR
ncbi:SAF domain-containing protein (plasmid) [Streptomyces sp. NBC_00053]|uniref:SAF domain-containing protein n=2 Tax=Streptomyces TaxID=1883 RepID=UPI0022543EF1|nr:MULTISPECIES: SAF domain-containing protein [unclassified Streptomyces]MCX5506044.1 SAF domain-containing protein [Streptomyces sp. NBC_00052]MCX5554301.1 SAF domain-containing protein [Streptomyces sp. NBC_00051]